MKQLPKYKQEGHPIHSCLPGLNSIEMINVLTSFFIMTSLNILYGTMLESAGFDNPPIVSRHFPLYLALTVLPLLLESDTF